MRQPGGEHAGLAGSRAGQHQQRTILGRDRGELLRIQASTDRVRSPWRAPPSMPKSRLAGHEPLVFLSAGTHETSPARLRRGPARVGRTCIPIGPCHKPPTARLGISACDRNRRYADRRERREAGAPARGASAMAAQLVVRRGRYAEPTLGSRRVSRCFGWPSGSAPAIAPPCWRGCWTCCARDRAARPCAGYLLLIVVDNRPDGRAQGGLRQLARRRLPIELRLPRGAAPGDIRSPAIVRRPRPVFGAPISWLSSTTTTCLSRIGSGTYYARNSRTRRRSGVRASGVCRPTLDLPGWLRNTRYFRPPDARRP